MTGEVKPQDERSGLVERRWVRISRRRGELTERTLEGEEVTARFLDDHASPHRIVGRVIRNAAGELAVPRDASVDVAGRRR